MSHTNDDTTPHRSPQAELPRGPDSRRAFLAVLGRQSAHLGSRPRHCLEHSSYKSSHEEVALRRYPNASTLEAEYKDFRYAAGGTNRTWCLRLARHETVTLLHHFDCLGNPRQTRSPRCRWSRHSQRPGRVMLVSEILGMQARHEVCEKEHSSRLPSWLLAAALGGTGF
jgi:hypothetical protein